MPRFTLQTEAVEFRGEVITVREMTAAEKMKWSSAVTKDRTITLALAVQMCTSESPPLTVESLAEEPAGLIEALAKAAFRLSGIETDEKKADSPATSSTPAGSPSPSE